MSATITSMRVKPAWPRESRAREGVRAFFTPAFWRPGSKSWPPSIGREPPFIADRRPDKDRRSPRRTPCRRSRKPSDRLGLPRSALARDLADHVRELVDVLEAAIHRRETDVGDLVDLLEFAHHELADAVARDFALTGRQQLVLDAFDRRVDRLGIDRPLAQREMKAERQLRPIVVGATAVLLHDRRQVEFGPLVGREATVAGLAATPALD